MKKIDEKSVKKYEKKKNLIIVIIVLILWLVSIFGLVYRAKSDETHSSEIYHSQEVKRSQTKPFPDLQLQSISTLTDGDIFLTNFGYAFNVMYQNGNDFTNFLTLIYDEVYSYIHNNTDGTYFPTFVPFFHTLPYSYGYGNYTFAFDYVSPGIGYIDDYGTANVNIGIVNCNVGNVYSASSFSGHFLFRFNQVDASTFAYDLIAIYSAYSFEYDTILVYDSANPMFDSGFWDTLFTSYGIGCYKLVAPSDSDALENAYNEGYSDGEADGYNEGYELGYDRGNSYGYQVGYSDGYAGGLDVGLTDGYNEGYSDGEADGYASGLDVGYDNGYSEGADTTFTNDAFKTLFNTILNAPYNIFKGMLNFEVFGVNLFGFLSFILTTFLIFGIINLVRKK